MLSWFCPASLPSMAIFPVQHPVPSNIHKYRVFYLLILCSKNHSNLIWSIIDWLVLLVIPFTLINHLQNHSLKASVVLLCSFFNSTFTAEHDCWKSPCLKHLSSSSLQWKKTIMFTTTISLSRIYKVCYLTPHFFSQYLRLIYFFFIFTCIMNCFNSFF